MRDHTNGLEMYFTWAVKVQEEEETPGQCGSVRSKKKTASLSNIVSLR